MFTTFKQVIGMIIILFLLLSCQEEKNARTISHFTVSDVPASAWKELSKKNIFFGHQSIGTNIMEGIADLMKENPKIQLKIVDANDGTPHKDGMFLHTRFGGKTDPLIILNNFTELMDKMMGDSVDIVLIRYIHNKIDSETKEIETVFDAYKKALTLLRKKYPGTIFVHSTLPLLVSKTTWKTWIKKLVGKKKFWEYDTNINLNRFNDLLKIEYSGKEPILDLARMQSTFPDGRRVSFTKNRKKYFSMASEYSYDGAHLNERGRKAAAEQFLLLLLVTSCSMVNDG
jgi:hypothetical protein